MHSVLSGSAMHVSWNVRVYVVLPLVGIAPFHVVRRTLQALPKVFVTTFDLS